MAKPYNKPVTTEADRILHAAARSGDAVALKALLQEQSYSHIDCRDAQGNTALILAARHGHVELVTALLDAGAEVNAHNNNLETALIAAAMAGDGHTTYALMNAGANSDHRDRYKHSAAFYAAQHDDRDLWDLFDRAAIESAWNRLRDTQQNLANQYAGLNEATSFLRSNTRYAAGRDYIPPEDYRPAPPTPVVTIKRRRTPGSAPR